MRKRTTQSALLVAGLAAGAAAAVTWLGRRRLTSVNTDADERGERESAVLPIGRSADRAIADRAADDALPRTRLPQDETAGSAWLAEREAPHDLAQPDSSLDEIWKSLPEEPGGEQSEGYDAVLPEDLGAVWLERATQTTHEDRMQPIDSSDLTELESAMVSEATLLSAQPLDEEDGEGDEERDDEGEESRRQSTGSS